MWLALESAAAAAATASASTPAIDAEEEAETGGLRSVADPDTINGSKEGVRVGDGSRVDGDNDDRVIVIASFRL